MPVEKDTMLTTRKTVYLAPKNAKSALRINAYNALTTKLSSRILYA
jgi:hypothetical protein